VVPHFQSGLFDSLTTVTFDRVDKTRITDMFSQQNEKVRAVAAWGACTHGRMCWHCALPLKRSLVSSDHANMSTHLFLVPRAGGV